MTPDTSTQARPRPAVEPELLIDTSRMNHGQREAMEVAESAREESDLGPAFAGDLFLGRFNPEPILPFPAQTLEDQRPGDEMVAKVCAFLAEHLDPDEVDETREIPAAVVDGLHEMGVFRMKVPQEYGGLGFSQVNYNRVLQAIASHCASTAVLVSAHQSIGVPQPLKMFGTTEQKAKYLPMISAGALSAFALTEPEVGSDPARMTTTAQLSADGTHYILNGEKLWTTNGPVAELLVVMAQTAPKIVRGRERRQITAFIVETDWPGVETAHRCDFMGLRGIQNGLLRFHDVRVPVENVLWGEGKGLRLALRTLNTGRLTLPAACAGLGKQCLSIARQWGEEREQWGKPIGRHEAGLDKIAHIAATTLAMEAVTWLTSHWADENRDIRIEAAMAKLFCSEASWQIADETLQLRGGRGYERAKSLEGRGETPFPVERMLRDCRINRIIEGTTEIMHLFLARESLDPHLTRAADVLRPGLPLGRKAKVAAKLAAYYAGWYARQLAGRAWSRQYWSMGWRLARHYRYIERTSHRLAARLFRAMVRYGPKLERRQMLLGHLMEIGTELFAMAATCAYARHLACDKGSDGALELADVFCRQARARIDGHFRAARERSRRRVNQLAGEVLDGRVDWLEEGILAIGATPAPPATEPTEVAAVAVPESAASVLPTLSDRWD
jgi:alkylation response protein AidB-like acyl-CoA dehydrogenase